MKLDGHCPGCGGGEGNQSCKIAKCSIQHGKIEYCNQCQGFFCLAVNLLDLKDLKTVVEHLAEEKKLESLTLKEKSAYAVKQVQSIAEQRGVVLKWNRTPSKPKQSLL